MDTCRSQNQISVKLLAAAPDKVLVAAAKSGDRPAFVKLWERHSSRAFTKVYGITRNRADAEDVMQNAWMNAYVHLKDFDGRAAFSTWFTRIAVNSALMTLRRKRTHLETSMEVSDDETWTRWEIADQKKDVEQDYVMHESVERLRQAIWRLRPTLRTVVEIHLSDDGSVREAANLAGISVAATKSRLSRARILLRRSVG
jgi:RNA polymerase sigma-70 factor, ECF subfamily